MRRSSASTRSRIRCGSRNAPSIRRSSPCRRRSTATRPRKRGIARANVAKAQASIDTIKAQVDELVVKAPVASQVYQIGAELGEYVSPGVPLLSLVDLSDVWLRFDLREDLARV